MLIKIEIILDKKERMTLRREALLNIEINISDEPKAYYKKMTIH